MAGISIWLHINSQEEFSTNEKSIVKSNQLNNYTIKNDSILDSRFDFNGLKTWIEPRVQSFIVNTTKSNLIEAENGTLISVPSKAFVDENGNSVTGNVDIKLIEALTLDDIVLYNLGTTADGKALQTGGMLHLEYLSDGKKVYVNPKRPLYIQVPTTKVEKDMQVFDGEVANGKVNWKNPQPLKKYLINIDFALLDFLPTGFADSVETFVPYKNHQINSKEFVDSLYYSLGVLENKKIENEKIRRVPYGGELRTKNLNLRDTVIKLDNKETFKLSCGINPLSIQTIKTSKFEKTFLATKEFEERLKVLHQLENGEELLKIYWNNLAKDLCFSDSLVSTTLTGSDRLIFKNFANQKLTNIKDAEIHQEQLSAYFNQQRSKFQKEQEQLKLAFNSKSQKQLDDLYADLTDATKKHGTFFSKAYRARVQSNPIAAATFAPQYYTFAWAKFGWVNIDAYLHILSKGSQEVNMLVSASVGTTEVYQFIAEVNNLTPLMINENKATVLVPKAGTSYAKKMENTFCMAISKNGDQYKWFDLRYNPYQSTSINVNLVDVDIQTIRAKLREYGVEKDLIQRINEIKAREEKEYKIQAEREAKRKKLQEEMEKAQKAIELKKAELKRDAEMMNALKKVAFNCCEPEKPVAEEVPSPQKFDF